jgi:phosphoglycerate dehydrogenase-like enzyme
MTLSLTGEQYLDSLRDGRAVFINVERGPTVDGCDH